MLRVESVGAVVTPAAPEMDVEPGRIVVVAEYPVVLVLGVIAPARIIPGGQGVPAELVVCCAAADTASVAPRTRVTLAARHRARWGRSMKVVRIVSSGLLPCCAPAGSWAGGAHRRRHVVPGSRLRPARRCSSRAVEGRAMRVP
ncbi:MAG: hypothetical protein ACJ79A_17265 [Gemmatimonadaceae bacterium]